MNVKVSVIIPVYNVELYLRECLESVVNQTLDNYEVIVVDDGSTDTSYNIACEYKENYDFIKILRQNNLGASAARNIGVKSAKGKYIYFLDSDDYIHKDTLKKSYELCEKNNLDILTFDAESFYDKNYKGSYFDEYDRKNKLDTQVLTGEDFFNKSVLSGAYRVIVMIYFYKRSFLNTNNLFFIEGMSLEDNLYVFQTLLKAKRIQYISDKFYYRRIRSGSVMTSNRDSKKDIELLKYIIKEEYKFYAENNFKNNMTIKCIATVIRDNYYIILRKINENSFNKHEEYKIRDEIKGLLSSMEFVEDKNLKCLIYHPKYYETKKYIKKIIKKIIRRG